MTSTDIHGSDDPRDMRLEGDRADRTPPLFSASDVLVPRRVWLDESSVGLELSSCRDCDTMVGSRGTEFGAASAPRYCHGQTHDRDNKGTLYEERREAHSERSTHCRHGAGARGGTACGFHSSSQASEGCSVAHVCPHTVTATAAVDSATGR